MLLFGGRLLLEVEPGVTVGSKFIVGDLLSVGSELGLTVGRLLNEGSFEMLLFEGALEPVTVGFELVDGAEL